MGSEMCIRDRSNHGGVAAVAFNGVHLTKLDLGVQSTTFEHVCVRVTAGTSSCVAAVIYRSGSESVKEQIFTEFRHMMDHLATFVDPIFVIGDLNIRLDRPSDPYAITLVDDLASYGFTNRVTSAMHVAGGMLDVVTRDYLPPPCVNVVDADLSDHHLLCWQAPLARPCPSYTTTTCLLYTSPSPRDS